MLTRKKLDPLEVYVPVVILTQFQIKDLGNCLFVLASLFPSICQVYIVSFHFIMSLLFDLCSFIWCHSCIFGNA